MVRIRLREENQSLHEKVMKETKVKKKPGEWDELKRKMWIANITAKAGKRPRYYPHKTNKDLVLDIQL